MSDNNNKTLIDSFSRTISYLRLSLTDRCNLKCLYCRPAKGGCILKQDELLTFEELLRIVSVAVKIGIRKVRITGGEPLCRGDAEGFIRELGKIPDLYDIRLTTNGVLLAEKAASLMDAGLSKINISLDTLNKERFKEITGFDLFDKVWDGIQRAKQLGFAPIKINTVVIRGMNDDEVVAFGKLSITDPFQVRFIEFMPMGEKTRWSKDSYVSGDEILSKLRPLGEIEAVERKKFDGPARIFKIKGAQGSIGLINPISHKFCKDCNRLRLAADGMLRSCLLVDQETDLRSILRQGASDSEIRKALIQTVKMKPEGHSVDRRGFNCHGQMSRIGG